MLQVRWIILYVDDEDGVDYDGEDDDEEEDDEMETTFDNNKSS